MPRKSRRVERANEAVKRVSEEKKELRDCPLCHEKHESMMLFGMEFIACPEMPENVIMPTPTLQAFMAGKSMLDQPFIVIT